jgi:hypothetical protein
LPENSYLCSCSNQAYSHISEGIFRLFLVAEHLVFRVLTKPAFNVIDDVEKVVQHDNFIT